METALLPGEVFVKEGAATMQRGIEGVGGWLYLTNQRLVFESHRFNIQTGVTQIYLGTISQVRPCWSRFLMIPVVPNSIAVSTTEGTEHRFMVYGRRTWTEEIEKTRCPRAV